MTRFIILCIIITIASCKRPPSSACTELYNNFSQKEIIQLQTLEKKFRAASCLDNLHSDSCHIGIAKGIRSQSPEIHRLFAHKTGIYQTLDSRLINRIWSPGEGVNISGQSYTPIFIDLNGAFFKFMEDLADKDSIIKRHVNRQELTGDIPLSFVDDIAIMYANQETEDECLKIFFVLNILTLIENYQLRQ